MKKKEPIKEMSGRGRSRENSLNGLDGKKFFEISTEKGQNGWRLVSGRESDKAHMRSQKQAEGRLVGPLC